jgi:hypothetical protein
MKFLELEVMRPHPRRDDEASIEYCTSPSCQAVSGANVLSSKASLYLVGAMEVASPLAVRVGTKFFELEVTRPQAQLNDDKPIAYCASPSCCQTVGGTNLLSSKDSLHLVGAPFFSH